MTVKGAIALLVFLGVFVGAIVFGSFAVGDPLLGGLSAIILAALVSVGAIVFKPFRDRFTKFVQANITLVSQGRKCRILVYGLPRSGKTTLIKRILTAEKPQREESTAKFDIYEEDLRLTLEDPKKYAVAIADYKGQKPSEVTVNPPERFFGAPGQRLINVILFVVDMFPEVKDANGERIDDGELVDKYEPDARKYLHYRVRQNGLYVNAFDIEQVFAVAYSEMHLFAVRLLINKIDLLSRVVSRGYLPQLSVESVDQYALGIYAATAESIKNACDANNVDNFSVHLISAAKGENIDAMFGDVLDAYSRKTR